MLGGFRQSHWRIAGLLTLGGCAALAFGSLSIRWAAWPPWAILAYWGVFLLLLLLTLYIAMVDIRYIQAEYAVMRRELFKETLGDEELRRALLEGERRMRENAKQSGGNDGGDPA